MENVSQRQLRCYLNWLALDGLPIPDVGWMQAIREAGYDGIQWIEPLDRELVDEAWPVDLVSAGAAVLTILPRHIV